MASNDKQLRMYDNGCDSVIAYSPEDASAAWCEQTGEKPEDYRHVWRERTADLTADIEGRTNGVETHPPAVWIERFGRGFLCSTEW